MLANGEISVSVALGQKTFLKTYRQSLAPFTQPENETAPALRELTATMPGWREDVHLVELTELTIDTTG